MSTSIAASVRSGTPEFRYGDHPLIVSRGSPIPEGATPTPSGINFVLICRHGTAVWLVLSEPCDGEIHAEIPLDPLSNRTGDHWHVRVDGLPDEFCYGYRVDGPKDNGHRYDPTIHSDRPGRAGALVRAPLGRRGKPAAPQLDDRIDDRSPDAWSNPRTPLEDTIIYELHVRGLHDRPELRREASREPTPGLVEKTPGAQGAGDHGGRAAAGRRVR